MPHVEIVKNMKAPKRKPMMQDTSNFDFHVTMQDAREEEIIKGSTQNEGLVI